MVRVVIALVAAAAVASGCESARDRRSILLITIDTLRPDHVTAAIAPALQALAAESVVFDTAISVGPLTLPGHASLLSGRLPPAHGVRDNHIHSLAPGTPTYPAWLASHGYDTAAFVSAVVLDRRYGLNAGFAVYDDEMPGEAPERSARDTLARAAGWLDARSADSAAAPFFLWVHLFEPHAPYRTGSYAGEVTAVDGELARFFERLQSRRLWQDLVVGVTSDHGESLGEHGEDTHGFFIYDSTIRIPWLLKAPGLRPGRFAPQVRLHDVMPTMIAFANAGDGTLSNVAGVDLSEHLVKGTDPGLDAYSETLLPKHQFDWAELRAIRTSGLKYIDAPEPELYRWRDDPKESRNLVTAERASAERMRAIVTRVAAEAAAAPTASPIDPVVAEKFMALGYIGQAHASANPGSGQGADPKQKVAIYRLVMTALTLSESGRANEALEALRQADALQNDVTQVHYLRGVILGGQERYAEAAAALERTVALNPRHVTARFKLALAYLRLKQTDRAEGILQAVVADEPTNKRAFQNLAAIAYTRGDLERAETLARRAVEIDTNYFDAWNTLGAVYVVARRPADALRALQTAVTLNAGSAQAHYNLALAHALGGETRAAATAYDRACSLDKRYCR